MFIDINPAFLIALLFFLVCGCYIFLCLVTLKNSTKSKLRDDYLSAGLCLVLYSLCYGLMTITASVVLCRVFWAVGFVSGCLFFTRWLVFSSNMVVIRFSRIRSILNAASALAIIISAICVLSNDTVFIRTEYGMNYSYNHSPFFMVAIIYMAIIILSFIVLFFRWWRESEMKRNRIQALLFLIASAIIAPIGIATDFIIPTFTDNIAIPLASICFLPVSMPLLVSMLRYKTLSITVPNASGYVFNTVTIPTLVLDYNNNISLENKAALDFWRSSLVGKNISEIVLTDQKVPEQSFFNGGFSERKVSVETPLGTRICNMVLAVENDKYDDVLCKVVLLKDITENEQKDILLLEALEQANSASKTKSNFLSSMSHEIRTPMNAIIGMTSIGKSAHTLEKKDDALNKIDGASKHLLGIINDILDMSKIEADKLELSDANFNFEKMLQNVVNVINFRVDERRQKFYVNIGENIPRLLIGDDQRLSQVITNLLSNAVKFTPDGGTIRLDTQVISIENDACCLQISVEDTGIGITDEQKARLFQAFEQAESDTSRKFGGTGLGLAISKRIVQLMGGDIWVQSEPGKGSKFIFTILLKHEKKEKLRLLDESVNWKNIRILVANNEPETIRFFTSFSETHNFVCAIVKSGEEALAELETNEDYDICFLDWELPDMNGIELTKLIRAKAANKAVVIICSSVDWQVIEDNARAVGIDKFLPKPLFSSAIVDMINECIGINHATIQENKHHHTDIFSEYSIILAEDIEINREIVLALLEPTRLKIDCAENGLKALELFSKAPEKYDLIFMDVQMPEMNGYEATQSIRALDIPQAKTIPIIAMTANVFREDIDKCLNAGMNDHVGKPLDLEEVIRKLYEFLSPDANN